MCATMLCKLVLNAIEELLHTIGVLGVDVSVLFKAWRSPAKETENIAPMRGSPKDSRIFTKKGKNLPNVLSNFKSETMGCVQACFNANMWAR